MIHKLVDKFDPILKTVIEPFDFLDPPVDPIELAHDLAQTMLHNDGIGIAAPQIGFPYRVFAIKADPILVCFNPRIVDMGTKTTYLDEGCLSFPGLSLKIKRPETIKVRFTMPNTDVRTETFSGLTARIFLHEYDHLDGVCFTQRATRYHLEQGKRRQKKLT